MLKINVEQMLEVFLCFVLRLYFNNNIVIHFFSTLKAYQYTLSWSPSNAWLLFSLIVIVCIYICIPLHLVVGSGQMFIDCCLSLCWP